MEINKNELYARRILKTFELIETVKELSKGKDKLEHPDLSDAELERRFWQRCRRQKDEQA